MDVVATKAAADFCFEYCTAGNGPLVMELETYRYHGHSMSDPDNTYRTREDIKGVRESRDPIMLAEKRALDAGWATEADLKAIVTSVKEEVRQAKAEALASPFPDVSQVAQDILDVYEPARGADAFTYH